MQRNDTAFLTDPYQLNMMAAYIEYGMTKTAVFELYVRKLPERCAFWWRRRSIKLLVFSKPCRSQRRTSPGSASSAIFVSRFSIICTRFVSPARSTPCPKASTATTPSVPPAGSWRSPGGSPRPATTPRPSWPRFRPLAAELKPTAYPVAIAPALRELAARLDRQSSAAPGA